MATAMDPLTNRTAHGRLIHFPLPLRPGLMAFEEAREELLAMPNWRPGECQSGCRRHATHELVIEDGDGVRREDCCEECGSLRLEAGRAAIDAGRQPAATLRVEPLAPHRHEAEGGRR
jgi:hypothetical protein